MPDQIVDRARRVIKAWHGRQHLGAEPGKAQHVFEVDLGQGRFPGHQDQAPALLDGHVGGALDQVRAEADRDARQGAHRTGADDHPAGQGGSRGGRRFDRVGREGPHPGGGLGPEPLGEHRGEAFAARPRIDAALVAQHLGGRRRQGGGHLGPGADQFLEQPFGVPVPAGAGDAHENARCAGAIHRGFNVGQRPLRRQPRRSARGGRPAVGQRNTAGPEPSSRDRLNSAWAQPATPRPRQR